MSTIKLCNLYRWIHKNLLCSILLFIFPSYGVQSSELDTMWPWPGDKNLIRPGYLQQPQSPLQSKKPTLLSTTSSISSQERMFVQRFELTGQTVFSAEELARVLMLYTNRTITAEELQEARRQLTLYYVERGYINSGAIIPEQQINDGIIKIHIIEGYLASVEVIGETQLRQKYFEDRLRPAANAPLKVQDVQERLQLLQNNSLIERLQAELAPGARLGEGMLRLNVQERNPYEIGLTVANNSPPSVGAVRAHLYGLDRNLTGIGDSLGLSYGHSLESSTADWRLFYARPLNAHETTLQLWAGHNETSVIEDRFATLDISSKLQNYGLSLTHPFYRTPQRSLALSFSLERRESESFLLGIPFSFAPGEEDGKSVVTAARIVQEWLDQQSNQVIAARSTFNFGLNTLGATRHEFEPDGQFASWLGQLQWARRFGEQDYQLIFKSILQLSNEPLLPVEKCALGGMDTVRGYPENALVRDECFVASLEFRAPVYKLPLAGFSRSPTEGWVHLAAFADYGYAKNKEDFDLKPNSIRSVGLGVRWEPSFKIRTALYWGYPFQEVDRGDESKLSSRINFLLQVVY